MAVGWHVCRAYRHDIVTHAVPVLSPTPDRQRADPTRIAVLAQQQLDNPPRLPPLCRQDRRHLSTLARAPCVRRMRSPVVRGGLPHRPWSKPYRRLRAPTPCQQTEAEQSGAEQAERGRLWDQYLSDRVGKRPYAAIGIRYHRFVDGDIRNIGEIVRFWARSAADRNRCINGSEAVDVDRRIGQWDGDPLELRDCGAAGGGVKGEVLLERIDSPAQCREGRKDFDFIIERGG
jgi:hypothetical protein